MRIDKLLAHCGYGTRKEVKNLLKEKIVFVNDQLVISDKIHVDPQKDKIRVGDDEIFYEEYVYYMLNKPQGYVSATVDNVYPTVIELIDDEVHDDLFPVGRLDVDTEGLLLITNDGKLAHRLLSPKHHVDKTYFTRVEGRIDQEDQKAFEKGCVLDDMTCLPAHLEIVRVDDNLSTCLVTIAEGKFHQVKRMFLSVGKKVVFLKRITMGPIVLDENLELGAYRRLRQDEIDRLYAVDML